MAGTDGKSLFSAVSALTLTDIRTAKRIMSNSFKEQTESIALVTETNNVVMQLANLKSFIFMNPQKVLLKIKSAAAN